MIDINLDNGECVSCFICNEKENEYRKIYLIIMGNSNSLKINICNECMSIFISKMANALNMEFPNSDKTDYDIELRIESKLSILLNKKISGIWNEDCQKELDSIDEKNMRNSHKLIYRQICDW